MSELDEDNKPRKRSLKATQISSKGLDFSVLFTAKFARQDINGYKVSMREPPGDTTGGGKQATQHIVLENFNEGGPTVTIGHANVATKTARLRTYSCIERMFQMRYRGRRFPIAQHSYQEAFDKMSEFIRRQGLQLDIESQPPEMTSIPPGNLGQPAEGGSNTAAWVILLLLLVAGAVGGFLVFSGKI